MKPYDQKLREAAEEFKVLCKKYDCIGVVLFVSPTHVEFVNEISASWSVMRFEEGQQKLRFKSKREEWPSLEAQKDATNSTVHAVTSLVQWSEQTHKIWSGVLVFLRENFTILYSKWDKPTSIPGDGK